MCLTINFYEAGNSSDPLILLIPGTCCHYSLFNKVLPLLQEKFYTVVASFDGFDESEKSEYISRDDETLKIEKYINERLMVIYLLFIVVHLEDHLQVIY